MALSTRYYPITFRLRNQAGAPIVGTTECYISVLQLGGEGNLSDSLPVDLGLLPPIPVEGVPTLERAPMAELRSSEEKDLQITSLQTDLGRRYIDPATFVAEVQVRSGDETAILASSSYTLQCPANRQVIQSYGVQIKNLTSDSELTAGIHYTVNYTSHVVTFSSGVAVGNEIEAVYRWQAVEEWNVVTDEEQIVGQAPFGTGTVVPDFFPLENFKVSVYNVTTSSDLVEDTNYTVNYAGPTPTITFTSGASDTDVVRLGYRSLDPDSDFWVDYNDVGGNGSSYLTRMTLTNDEWVTFKYEYIWRPGIYAYLLDVDALPDGRYLVDIEYSKGSLIRVGDQQFIVREGTVLDDFLGNAQGMGLRRLLIRTRVEAEQEEDQEVLGDVLVSIFDAAGDQVIMQVRTATATGNVRLAMPEGTYQVYAYRSLTSFDNPEEIIVEATADEQVFTLFGTSLASVPPSQGTADCCMVYGNVQSLDCEPAEGVVIRAILKRPPRVIGGSAILAKEACTVTDVSGNFQMSLVRGTTVTFDIQGTRYESTRVVPDADSVFFDEMERA